MKKIKIFSIIAFICLMGYSAHPQVRIKMIQEGGVYTTPCTVNGLKLRFIFDTGASNVSMSLSEAIFMLKNGYLNKDDLHGSSYSQIANGDIVENTTVNIKELEIGGIKIHDVEATIIHELTAPLLLGQSAIQKLGKIQIDDDELIIMNLDSPLSENACKEAEELSKQAEKYYIDELWSLSSDTYQKAFDICPDAIDCFELRLLGNLYLRNGNYLLSIKYLEKSAKCESNIESLMWVYQSIGESYSKLGKYDISVLNTQKALTYATKDDDITYLNSRLGHLYENQEKYYEAIDYYTKNVNFYLKYLKSSNNDVMKGKVKDEDLGYSYWNISFCYYKLGENTKSDSYMIKSALCGYENAKSSCNKYGIKYELYIE